MKQLRLKPRRVGASSAGKFATWAVACAAMANMSVAPALARVSRAPGAWRSPATTSHGSAPAQAPAPTQVLARVVEPPMFTAEPSVISLDLADEKSPGATQGATPSAATDAVPGAATVTLVADGAPGQSVDDLQKRLSQVSQRLGQLEKTPLDTVTLVLPGVTSGIPTAYGAGKGDIVMGAGYQRRTRYSHVDDGTAGVVVGFGDSKKLGIDVQFTVLDLSDLNRSSVSLKLHRELAKDLAVAVGCENLVVIGPLDSDRSFYVVATKKLRLKESSREPFSRLHLTGGIGNGRFRPQHIVARDTGSINVFGSAAINLRANATLFTEWTGQALDIGASLAPFKNLPIVITPALADIAGPAGDGARFTLGVSYVPKY